MARKESLTQGGWHKVRYIAENIRHQLTTPTGLALPKEMRDEMHRVAVQWEIKAEAVIGSKPIYPSMRL